MRIENRARRNRFGTGSGGGDNVKSATELEGLDVSRSRRPQSGDLADNS